MAQKKVITIAPKGAPKAEAKADPKAAKAAPAAPKAKAEAKADSKPKAKAKAESAPKPKAESKAESFALHLNKTGRLVISAQAAERLELGLGESENQRFALLTIEGKIIRLVPQKKDSEGALPVRNGGGRPYISATKAFKSLGWEGMAEAEGRNIAAKPYGAAGFEFSLS